MTSEPIGGVLAKPFSREREGGNRAGRRTSKSFDIFKSLKLEQFCDKYQVCEGLLGLVTRAMTLSYCHSFWDLFLAHSHKYGETSWSLDL